MFNFPVALSTVNVISLRVFETKFVVNIVNAPWSSKIVTFTGTRKLNLFPKKSKSFSRQNEERPCYMFHENVEIIKLLGKLDVVRKLKTNTLRLSVKVQSAL